jgi:hypothetical protein
MYIIEEEIGWIIIQRVRGFALDCYAVCTLAEREESEPEGR